MRFPRAALALARMRGYLRADRDDDGSAVIEFVFVAVLVTVPLVYLIVAVASVERAQVAVTNAAREAGRAFATAETADAGHARALVGAKLAFTDAGLTDEPVVWTVAAGASCDAPPVPASVRPGVEFTVCVRRETSVPGVPSILQGRGITNEARYLVHIDDYRRS